MPRRYLPAIMTTGMLDTPARHLRRADFVPVAALLAAMLSFTLGATLAKQLYPSIGPQGATAMRLVVGAIYLAPMFRPWRLRPAGHWRVLLCYGVSLGVMNLMFYSALQTIPLGVAISIEILGPLSVAVASSSRKADFLWIGLSVLGVALLLPPGHLAPHLDMRGIGFALAAALGWASYIVFGQKAGKALGAGTAAAGMGVGALVVGPIGIAHAGSALFSPRVMLLGLLVGFFSSALPYALEMVALRRLRAGSFSTMVSGEPAIGAVVGFLFLGEVLSVTQWVAIWLIMLASAGAAMGSRRQDEA